MTPKFKDRIDRRDTMIQDSWIGFLVCQWEKDPKDSRYSGTAFILMIPGQRPLIMTAAHNVCRRLPA